MLALAGKTGIGKTVAAVFFSCLNTKIIRESWRVGDDDESGRHEPPDLWFVTGDLVIANAYNRKDTPAGMTDGRVIDLKGVMIVDEIDKVTLKSGWSFDKFGLFFNERYANKLPTIVTTNLENRDEFYEKYGAWMRGRFNKWCRWIHSEGEDLRCTQAKT